MDIISTVNQIINNDGIYFALKFINSRTPHRFTGIYRFDGDILRNLFLFDVFDPNSKKGEDVPMVNAYCANVGRADKGIEFSNIASENKIKLKTGSPVISYCGALILDYKDKPYGTLCHFDMKPCDTLYTDLPVLESLTHLFYKALIKENMPKNASLIAEDKY